MDRIEVKIAAVIVTYNRLNKLKYALSCYESQEMPFTDIIVVDNKSTDGTSSFLEMWENEKGVSNRHVIYMNENLGGSGGFHDGCEYALTLNPDWVFVADDDAYPERGLVREFVSFLRIKVGNYSSVCATVMNMDNTIAYHHRRFTEIKRLYKLQTNNSTPEDYDKDCFPIDEFSYVGTFMRTESLRKAGLCIRDFFIYFDDSEHAIRMGKTGEIICVPSLKIYHDDGFTSDIKSSGQTPMWRTYYNLRNSIFSFLKHYPIVGFYRIVAFVLKGMLTTNGSKEEIKMRRTAIKDAISGRLGKHPIYRP